VKKICLVLILLFAGVASAAPSRQQAVEKGLQQFVEAGGAPGLTAALITPQGTQFYTYGVIGEDPKRTLDEHTQFAVASISKLLTTLTVADLVREGKLRFADTAEEHLPKGSHLPTKDGKVITLANLATHTSGITPVGDLKKFALAKIFGWKYILKHFYQEPLSSAPGAKFFYNNQGLTLLGHVGELVDGRPYEDMVQARILKPLGMENTWVTKPAKTPDPVGAFPFGFLAPAAGFNSNATDLAKFAAAAALSGAPETLQKDFAISFEPQGKDEGGRDLHLGWHGGTEPLQLNHTGRNNIYVGVDLKRHVAMVILCTDQTLLIGDLGQAALTALGGGKSAFPKPAKIIKLSAEALQAYAGEYRHESAGTVQVKADPKAGVLLLAFGGKGDTVLWPQENGSFHCKEWHCDLAYTPATKDKAARVTITMDGWAGDYVKVAGK
jgi:CubicO group peptidase (beta-lactamase class C family)